MRKRIILAALGVLATTAPSMGYAASFASVSGTTTCSLTTLSSTSILGTHDFQRTMSGVAGGTVYGDAITGCGAAIAIGDTLTLSTDFTLVVSDQGYGGAAGGVINFAVGQLIAPFYPPIDISAGDEYARAAIQFWAGDGRTCDLFCQHTFYSGGGEFILDTVQDGLPDSFSAHGTINVSATTTWDLSPVGATISLWADVYAQDGVSPIPEPESWAQFLAGLALISVVTRGLRGRSGAAPASI